jgi:hypothetical protein
MRSLSLAFALALTSFATTASAQQGGVTWQCDAIRSMMWLAIAAGMDGSPDYATMAERERIACGMGMEAGPTEYWPSGGVFRSGETWYYPSGGVARSGETWYYPSGGTARSGTTWYYPSGGVMRSGGTWYLPSGAASSESGVVSYALPRVSRERGDELMGLRRGSTDEAWAMTYLVVLVSEASRS